ncbi:MAG: hypothetical protein NTZ26_08815 [Candidatus Aminicenantes bacterium]|nr:hypothetical protein [Candidatus Aminicenantes bacterium]
MNEECPFCWSRNVKQVGAHPVYRGADNRSRLMECGDCEKWYWADRQQEAGALFLHCRTTMLHPQRCYEEVREIQQAAGTGFPRRRLAEFNHLCAECPHGCFRPSLETPSRRKSSAVRAF